MASYHLSWPNWHPTHELTARDLRQMEAYFTTAVSLFEPCVGLHTFDVQQSLMFAFERERLLVRVTNVKGFSLSGYPIIIAGSDYISAALAVGDRASVTLDVYIEVNPASRPNTPLDEQPPKFVLLLAHTPGEAFEREKTADSLFVGRYRVGRDECPRATLLIQPRLFRLATTAGDAGWMEWTAPLRERLSEVISDLSYRSATDLHLISAAVHAYSLGATWPQLSLSQLVLRLNLLNALLSCKTGDAPSFAGEDYTWTLDISPREVPKRLAALISPANLGPVAGQRIELISLRYVEVVTGPRTSLIRILRDLPAGKWELVLLAGNKPPTIQVQYRKAEYHARLAPASLGERETIYDMKQLHALARTDVVSINAEFFNLMAADVRIYFTRA